MNNWKEELKRIIGDLNIADDFIPDRETVELAVFEKYTTEIIEKLIDEVPDSYTDKSDEADTVIITLHAKDFKQQLRDKWLGK